MALIATLARCESSSLQAASVPSSCENRHRWSRSEAEAATRVDSLSDPGTMVAAKDFLSGDLITPSLIVRKSFQIFIGNTDPGAQLGA
jgi:hypothetical protein